MTKTHIMKAFDEELGELTTMIAAMGNLAAMLFAESVQALLQSNIEMALNVIDQDQQVDALKRKVTDRAVLVITRRQPVAGDLDEILAGFKIIEDLERIGDLAKNIAKRATVLVAEPFPQDIVEDVERLSGLASAQVRQGLDAYVSRNAEQALIIRQQDDAIDRLHTALFKKILVRMTEDHAHVVGFVHLLFCAKNIERVGDHATNIAEAAYLAATGVLPADERVAHDGSSTTSTDIGPRDHS
jgi:phosphate transport system protein